MAELVRTRDWSSTRLGPIEDWSDVLLSSVNLMLACAFPSVLFWGPEMIQFYNDAYLPLMAEKSPGALGQRGEECWREAWHIIGPQLDAVLQRGETVYQENVLVPVMRNGRVQDIYWIYSYSPVYERGGAVAGILVVCQDVTAGILANQQLRESETRATRILQSIGDAVIVTDAETQVTRINPVAETLTGWKAGEAVGRPLAEIFHIVNEETRQLVESPTDKVKRLGNIVGLANHTVLIARDGRETHIDDSGAPIRDDRGDLTGIVLVFRDIDEKRAAERERDAIAGRLRQVLEVTTDSVLSIDRNWRITYMNPRAREVSAPSGEVVGKDFWESFPGTVYEGSPYVEHYRRAMNGGVAGEFEAFYPEPLDIWVKVQVRPTSDGIVLFFRDVTVQKQEEGIRREGVTKLQLATEAAELGIFVWDIPQDRVTWENERVYQVFGRSHEDGPIHGVEFGREIVHPDFAAHYRSSIAETIRTGARFHFQGKFRRKDESLGWVELTGQLERGPDGSPSRMLGTVLDITTRKQAEEALRTTEKLAAVGRLAASIAHEINNPLESVTNLLYLARTSESFAEVQEYLESAERELRRVSVISNQTLRFHKQSSRPTEVTCVELIENVLSIYHGRILNSSIDVLLRKRAMAPILCFEGEIRQVLNNLIGNAIDAMSPRGGRLLVRSREGKSWTTGEMGMTVTIADTGSGMSSQTVKRVFEPFFTTKGFGGTGLGLWISQEIVARHEGVLRVRSSQKEGHTGTVFTLFLPFAAVSRTDGPATQA